MSVKRIALCGAHGTGKTTLLELLKSEYQLEPLARTVRTFWEDHGIDDFEKLPKEVRNVFQKHLLLNQIDREEAQAEVGFITDRSILDYMGYTVASSDMSGVELAMYEALVRERLKQYTHFIYLPVEFPAKAEHLRAHPEIQQKVADVLESYLQKWLKPEEYCIARGSVEERMTTIREFLDKE